MSEHIETLTARVAVLETALTETRIAAAGLAEDAIGLLFEYRDVHRYDEKTAAAAALQEICEGLQAVEDIAIYKADMAREGVS